MFFGKSAEEVISNCYIHIPILLYVSKITFFVEKVLTGFGEIGIMRLQIGNNMITKRENSIHLPTLLPNF